MTKVYLTEREGKLTLKVLGHSGYANIGQDIVCASCSILAYTVAQFVKTAEKKGDLKSAPILKLDIGDAEIVCEPTEDGYNAIRASYLFSQVGYALLAYNYPKYVSIQPMITD